MAGCSRLSVAERVRVHGSRGKVADALAIDVVVDDRPDNCLDVVLESRAASLLVWRGRAATVPASVKRLGIAVVPTVARVSRRSWQSIGVTKIRCFSGCGTFSGCTPAHPCLAPDGGAFNQVLWGPSGPTKLNQITDASHSCHQ